MNDNDWQPHEPVSRTEYVVFIERQLEALSEKLKAKDVAIDLMGQLIEKLQAELDDLQESSAKKLQEALANSDACWKLEQEMYVRQRDEARADAERFREALSEVSTWREDCHAHDEDMGYPLRDMDEEEIERIAEFAKRTLTGGRR